MVREWQVDGPVDRALPSVNLPTDTIYSRDTVWRLVTPERNQNENVRSVHQ